MVSSDSDRSVFTQNSFRQNQMLLQACFSAHVANIARHEFLESYESTVLILNAISISYDGKIYVSEFSDAVPGGGKDYTLRCQRDT